MRKGIVYDAMMKRLTALLLALCLCLCAASLCGCSSDHYGEEYVTVPLTRTGRNKLESACLSYAEFCDLLGLPSHIGGVYDGDGTLTAVDTRVLRCVLELSSDNVICVYDIVERRYGGADDDAQHLLFVREMGFGPYEPLGPVTDGVQFSHAEPYVRYESSAALDADEYASLRAYLEEIRFDQLPTLPDEEGMGGWTVRVESDGHLIERWCPGSGDEAREVFERLQTMAADHGLAHTEIVITEDGCETLPCD